MMSMLDPRLARLWYRSLVLAALLVRPALLFSQDGVAAPPFAGEGATAHAAAPHAVAVRTSAAIRIDGTLDEGAWAGAAPITALTQLDPSEGQPVSERTEVRVV